jgi:acetyl-CoA synthetase
MSDTSIESTLREGRVFPPDPEFVQRANVSGMEAYEALYKQSVEDPEGFWAGIASGFEWFRPWDTVLEWKEPFARWFVGGRTNLAYNCLDRHLGTWRKNRAAIIWEGEPGDVRVLTYQMLHREVCRFANALDALGMKEGDRATLYLGMVPELPIAMLACARLGITHNVVFGGFSAEALGDRINDSESRILITADGGHRRGAIVPLKANADKALENTPTIERVVVVRRTGEDVPMQTGRELWWDELTAGAGDVCPARELRPRTGAAR